ncbi:MAG: glycoside hydrolase family 3 N-terminal domain-containing protein [Acidimicrobiales bacterium]
MRKPVPQRHSRIRHYAAIVTLVAVAACSGSDSAGNPSTPSTVSVTTVAPTTAPPPTTTLAPTTTTLPPTTTLPRSADELAGARVVCSYPEVDVPADLLARLRAGKAAGVLWYGENLPNAATAVRNAAAIQQAAAAAPNPAPAIIATDQEGGAVRRIPGPPEASAQALAALGTAAIRDQGKASATALRQWGINVNLAPVADVGRTGSFLMAQARSFGTDPAAVGADVVAFVTGLRDGGVAATLKHFPGLGAAVTNTDLASSVVDVPADILRSTDLAPFAAGIGARTDIVMISSAKYPALDSVPAVVSRVIVHDVLRGQLAFNGVVISDAFDTDAVAAVGPIASTAVAAANAGVDVFIARHAPPCAQIQEALANAITDGRIPRADAEAAYARVMQLRRGLPGD